MAVEDISESENERKCALGVYIFSIRAVCVSPQLVL